MNCAVLTTNVESVPAENYRVHWTGQVSCEELRPGGEPHHGDGARLPSHGQHLVLRLHLGRVSGRGGLQRVED